MTDTERAYIAGFLDGDGSIILQIVRRKDYVLGFQIRASICFYQKVSGIAVLDWIKRRLERGSIRLRGDMADYTIVGLAAVKTILGELQPFLVLKRGHVEAAAEAIQLASTVSTHEQLLRVAVLVDQFSKRNYSKHRSITAATVRSAQAIF